VLLACLERLAVKQTMAALKRELQQYVTILISRTALVKAISSRYLS